MMRLAFCTLLLVTTGCSSTYYGLMDAFGHGKRDILLQRVRAAQAEQADAKHEVVRLEDAFRQLAATDRAAAGAPSLGAGLDLDDPLGTGGRGSGSNGGSGLGDDDDDVDAAGFGSPPPGAAPAAPDRSAAEQRMKEARSAARDRAQKIERRIASFHRVAGDMYLEWSQQALAFSDADMRERSLRMLQDTKSRYDVLLEASRKAEAQMRELLQRFEERLVLREHAWQAGQTGLRGSDVLEMEEHVASALEALSASVVAAGDFLAGFEATRTPPDEEMASFRAVPGS